MYACSNILAAAIPAEPAARNPLRESIHAG
jgi:hypothetical protein